MYTAIPLSSIARHADSLQPAESSRIVAWRIPDIQPGAYHVPITAELRRK
jgi:hypothetical protein